MEHPIRSRQRALSEIDQERYITEEREKRVSQFRIRNFQNDYNERLYHQSYPIEGINERS